MLYGYARVSTRGQAKDGNSLEAQENRRTDESVSQWVLGDFAPNQMHFAMDIQNAYLAKDT